MDGKNVQIYEPELGLNGSLGQLIDWSTKYTDDFSDEALERISELAKCFDLFEGDIRIPLLERDARKREKEDSDCKTLPYERMIIDHYIYGNVSYSETRQDPYMEIEIREERGNILIQIVGQDDNGLYTAANTVNSEEFIYGNKDGDDKYLERLIGETLFYGKVYEEEEVSA